MQRPRGVVSYAEHTARTLGHSPGLSSSTTFVRRIRAAWTRAATAPRPRTARHPGAGGDPQWAPQWRRGRRRGERGGEAELAPEALAPGPRSAARAPSGRARGGGSRRRIEEEDHGREDPGI
ncbi:unnamed protein product [Prorocentrum cordatum]|uniref:Uncharacterized protein n=1 Tax=Prorocentrum cordatum TaxID=2364126 RepID=A0ABN9XIM9_9DINO|nr:unnamed protein product [Polarella glacialis]